MEDLENISPEIKANLAQHMAFEHLSSGEQGNIYLQTQRRYNYVTPKSFLELIDFYKSLLIEKRGEVEHNIERLDTGLATLNNVKKDVLVATLHKEGYATFEPAAKKKRGDDDINGDPAVEEGATSMDNSLDYSELVELSGGIASEIMRKASNQG